NKVSGCVKSDVNVMSECTCLVHHVYILCAYCNAFAVDFILELVHCPSCVEVNVNIDVLEQALSIIVKLLESFAHILIVFAVVLCHKDIVFTLNLNSVVIPAPAACCRIENGVLRILWINLCVV